MQVKVTHPISAPIDVVWDCLCDIPSAADFISGIIEVEILSPGPYAPGFRWRETRKMFGMKATEEMVVTEAQEPTRTAYSAINGGTEYRMEFDLSESPEGGTVLEAAFASTVHNAPAFARVLSVVTDPIAKKACEKALTQDLADLADEAARRAGH